jgi:hypothetical protein
MKKNNIILYLFLTFFIITNSNCNNPFSKKTTPVKPVTTPKIPPKKVVKKPTNQNVSTNKKLENKIMEIAQKNKERSEIAQKFWINDILVAPMTKEIDFIKEKALSKLQGNELANELEKILGSLKKIGEGDYNLDGQKDIQESILQIRRLIAQDMTLQAQTAGRTAISRARTHLKIAQDEYLKYEEAMKLQGELLKKQGTSKIFYKGYIKLGETKYALGEVRIKKGEDKEENVHYFRKTVGQMVAENDKYDTNLKLISIIEGTSNSDEITPEIVLESILGEPKQTIKVVLNDPKGVPISDIVKMGVLERNSQ